MSSERSSTQAPLFETLEGPRVLIRPYTPEDADELYQAIAESRERLRPWLPFADGHQTVDESREYIEWAHARWLRREEMHLGVFSRTERRLFGAIGLHPRDASVPSFEIGYWLRTSAERQGYSSEAVATLTDFVVRQLAANRIEIRCDARNERSAAVAERRGFVREGLLRNQRRAPSGALRDTLIFSLTPADPHWPSPH